MPFTDYFSNAVLQDVFGNVAYSPPATIYVGLSTTLPTNAGGNITEPVGASYARVVVTNDMTSWASAVNQRKSNGAAFTFPMATGNWGVAMWYFIADASTGGNVLWWGQFLPPGKTLETGDTASFAAAALRFGLL